MFCARNKSSSSYNKKNIILEFLVVKQFWKMIYVNSDSSDFLNDT